MTRNFVQITGTPFLCGLMLLEFAIVANSKVCDLKPSIKKGATYYRSMTPWGKWLDMPCPPRTVFVQRICGCDHPWQRQSKLISVLTTKEPEVVTRTLLAEDKETVQALDRKMVSGIKISDDFTNDSDFTSTTTQSALTNHREELPSNPQVKSTVDSLSRSNKSQGEMSSTVKSVSEDFQTTTSKPIPINSTPQPTLQSSVTKANIKVADDNEKELNQTEDEVKSFLLSELSIVDDVSTLIALPSSTKSTPKMLVDLTTEMETPSPKDSLTDSAALTSSKSMAADTALSSPPSIKTPTGIPTFSTSVANACELRAVTGDVTSYMGYVNEEVGWIQFQCPTGQEFSTDICWCFDPRKTTQSISSFIPPDCQYFKEGKTSFKEYIDFLQSWVYSECSDGYEFSQLKCGCVLAGTLPEAEKHMEDDNNVDDAKKTTALPPSTAKIPNGCLNVAEGPNSFKSYVSNLGVWVYSDCPSGAYFDQAVCGCITPEEKAKNECPYRSYGQSSYTHYIAAINDNVYYQCPDNHAFNEILCTCIAKGSSKWKHQRRTTRSPHFVTSSVTKPFKHDKVPENCKKIGDSMTSYKEYIDVLGDWVYSDCGVGELFVQEKCGCFRGDDSQIKPDVEKKPSTTIAPKATDCDKERTGKSSFKSFVTEINDWVYSDCPSNHVFNQTQCKCVFDKTHMRESHVQQSHVQQSHVHDHEHSTNNSLPVHTRNNGSSVVTKGSSLSTNGSSETTNGSSVVTNQSQMAAISPSVSRDAISITRIKKNDKSDEEESSKKSVPISPHIFRHARLVKVMKQLVADANLPQSGDSACTSVKTGKSSFKKFIPDLNDWVFADCQEYYMFSVELCDCVPEGGDVIPQDVTVITRRTTEAPISVTNPDCPYETRGAGYRKYISQLGDWVYYECPSGKTFSVTKCDCIDTGVIGSGCSYEKANDGQYRRFIQQLNQWIYYQCPIKQSFSEETCQCIEQGVDPTKNGEKKVPGTSCMSRPSDIGKEYFIMSFPLFGEILYTCEFGYLYSPERCECVPEKVAVDDSAKNSVTSASCALQQSDKGPAYFRMQISDQQWIDLSCPRNERFSAERCSCLPA